MMYANEVHKQPAFIHNGIVLTRINLIPKLSCSYFDGWIDTGGRDGYGLG